MEPRQSSPEHLPRSPMPPDLNASSRPEVAVGDVYKEHSENVERAVATRVETIAQPTAPPASALPAPVPITPIYQVSDDNSASSAPLVAADDDLIEKEWVDKAKKVISETKDDPHLREQEVKKLQIEYIRKRYGRVIGGSDEIS